MKKFIQIEGQIINTDHIVRVVPGGRPLLGYNDWQPVIWIYTTVGTIQNNPNNTKPVEFWVGKNQTSEKAAITEASNFLANLFSENIINVSE